MLYILNTRFNMKKLISVSLTAAVMMISVMVFGSDASAQNRQCNDRSSRNRVIYNRGYSSRRVERSSRNNGYYGAPAAYYGSGSNSDYYGSNSGYNRTNDAYYDPYYDPYGSNQPGVYDRHRKAVNIGVGTVAGAAVGAAVGGRKGAIMGAAAGAIGGAIVTAKQRPRNYYPY
jgi:hypothetical protein